jgi:hypothetical protein
MGVTAPVHPNRAAAGGVVGRVSPPLGRDYSGACEPEWVGQDAEFIAEQIAALSEVQIDAEGEAVQREAVSASPAPPVTEGV